MKKPQTISSRIADRGVPHVPSAADASQIADADNCPQNPPTKTVRTSLCASATCIVQPSAAFHKDYVPASAKFPIRHAKLCPIHRFITMSGSSGSFPTPPIALSETQTASSALENPANNAVAANSSVSPT